MNILLIFFAIPLATIILSIIFETIIQCPLKIAGIAFSIFLIVAFALGGSTELLVAVFAYTLISFVSAFITMLIQNELQDNDDSNHEDTGCWRCANQVANFTNNRMNASNDVRYRFR